MNDEASLDHRVINQDLLVFATDPLAGAGLPLWLPDGAVELVSYAHSIDFGAKGYGNLVELAWLQRHVAGALGRPTGRLLMVVKSAHVYESEFGYLRDALAAQGR